ncbi:UDP-N-acetyl-D-mannosamine dehydrogenase [Planctomycetales bacterium]|nr:UDP-N-acetyl-D-mannosamine dehydrogenase [Planctomycetales bacterium]GHT01655.1 UDP-N-acetyl-D-mannosamine dehydrogenase [Planctomycetales bacterium]GHT08351.1 UDP-N-acetyl-D-mannosamine dehydrogenase [Planctomycetales bacterium]
MKKIAIIGGCGHVGIPLGLALASRNFTVTLVDISDAAVAQINRGELPFTEQGAVEILQTHLDKNLFATTDARTVATQDAVIFVVGTPVDEHHNPKTRDILKVINAYLPLLHPRQLIILRSTIFPGTAEVVAAELQKHFGAANLAFCPERILQGKGIEEIFTLPQIIAASSDAAFQMAVEIFAPIAPKIIRLAAKEAELVKLITNTWRYLEFAAANAFYMMVESEGLDFYRVYNAVVEDYPRAQHFPKAGLAAGPCLFKDTMQLSAFYQNNFFLGQSAMLVNEGLPNFLVAQLEKKLGGLAGKNIAILGMTFKANNDDTRESLSFKIKKLLEFKMATVPTHDPYLSDSTPLDECLRVADGIILGTPHREYKSLRPTAPFVDCWGFWR